MILKANAQIVRADARRIPLPDESVQCVVTSPPYWGLRKYKGDQDLIWAAGLSEAKRNQTNVCAHEWTEENISAKSNWETFVKTDGSAMKSEESIEESSRFYRGTCLRYGAWRGAFGLEPTVEMYVQHTVEILHEIRRVLRKDGVVFWNIGDSYAGSWGNFGARDSVQRTVRKERFSRDAWEDHNGKPPMANPQYGLKPKDLCLIPARVALAAQADGWWIRSLIIWAKPNPMPESVTDRPADAYEHILMLTKSERYFWDAEAVREPHQDKAGIDRFKNGSGINAKDFSGRTDGLSRPPMTMTNREYNPAGRNLRNVWTFPTQPYSGAHFATFPDEIPRRAILAATSACGACVRCGSPWKRLISREDPPQELRTRHNGPDNGMVMGFGSTGSRYGSGQKMQDWRDAHPAETVGWEPTCECEKETGRLPETAACLVLDPFGGSGTTGRVAIELNRRAVLLDLAYSADAYAPLAQERLSDVQREMFA